MYLLFIYLSLSFSRNELEQQRFPEKRPRGTKSWNARNTISWIAGIEISEIRRQISKRDSFEFLTASRRTNDSVQRSGNNGKISIGRNKSLGTTGGDGGGRNTRVHVSACTYARAFHWASIERRKCPV